MDKNRYDEWPPPAPVIEDPGDEIRRSRIAYHLDFDFEGLLEHLAYRAENATGNSFVVHAYHPTTPTSFRVSFEIQDGSPLVFRITSIEQAI